MFAARRLLQVVRGAPALLPRNAYAAASLHSTSLRLHGHSHDGKECGHSHGPPEQEERGHGHSHGSTPEPLDQQTGLPLEQRAKNILVGNFRAQLTTIVAEKREGCVM